MTFFCRELYVFRYWGQAAVQQCMMNWVVVRIVQLSVRSLCACLSELLKYEDYSHSDIIEEQRFHDAGHFAHVGLCQFISWQRSMQPKHPQPWIIEPLLLESGSKATTDPWLYITMSLYAISDQCNYHLAFRVLQYQSYNQHIITYWSFGHESSLETAITIQRDAIQRYCSLQSVYYSQWLSK